VLEPDQRFKEAVTLSPDKSMVLLGMSMILVRSEGCRSSSRAARQSGGRTVMTLQVTGGRHGVQAREERAGRIGG
jgi:hypothetical protein